MKQRAYAKINLSLDVFGVREDGYHELNSIMLPVNFYDLLEIDIAERTATSATGTISVTTSIIPFTR